MANLTTVGNTELKGTGSVTLADLVTNRFTRTLSADGHARVNSVQPGSYPTEETIPHSLDDWNGYDHNVIDSGGDLAVAVGYEEVTMTWTRNAGYADGAATLRQLMYFRSMGTSEDLSLNPFDTPTGTDDAGDGESYVVDGLVAGNFYAVGMKVEFDDSDELFLPADAAACNVDSGETPLTGAGEGLSTGVAVFGSNPGPLSVTQVEDPGSCSPPADVTLRIASSMAGPSTGRLEENINGAGFTLVDASVGAGSTVINVTRASDGDSYQFRLRYNDVSPDNWATQTGTIEPECTLP